MRKRSLLPIALLAAAAGCSASAEPSDSGPGVPALTGRVVDNADLLPPQVEARLTAGLAALERRTGDQVVVVTLPSLGGEPIEAVGRRLGNRWGLGRKELDNGVLLVVAPAEKMVRIEVGEGLEGLLTDEKAKAIIDHGMIPLFRAGQHARAIESGSASILQQLEQDRQRPQPLPIRKVP